MAPPKGRKKSQLSAKAQLQPYGPARPKKLPPKLPKTFQRLNAPDIHVQLPNPLAYKQGDNKALTIRVKAEPIAPLAATVTSLVHVQAGKKNVPVWLPDSKPFPFMDLPGELRNKVYGYFFQRQHYKIKFISGSKALTYILPERPVCEDPKVPLSAARRRRQWDYPRRVRSNETDIPPFELMPGPCALLLAHPKIGREAAPMFYELQTFSFSSCRVLNQFMDMLPASSKQAITDVRLRHYTAGYPRWNYIAYRHTPTGEIRQYGTQIFKVKNDHVWEDTLWRLSDEMCNLEKLSLGETINEIPMEVHANAHWRIPLGLALSEMKLKEVNIYFKSWHAEPAVLEVEAYILQQELLAEPYRDSDNAIENVSDSEVPVRLLPEKRGTAKIVRMVMPGYERRPY